MNGRKTGWHELNAMVLNCMMFQQGKTDKKASFREIPPLGKILNFTF
jgi:hypothetical protein